MVGTGIAGVRVSDSFLRLYDGTGALLGSDDDGPPGSNSTISFTATTTGTYYLDAASYGDAGRGQYGLSATLGTKANYDEEMGAGALTRPGTSWSTPGTSATVTWGVRATNAGATDADGSPTPFIPLTTAQIAAVQASLGQYSEVANITFVQVNPGGTTDDATILAGAYSSKTDGAGAYAMYPGSAATAGDINLNNTSVSTTSLPDGSYSSFAVLHELGHAIGLAHPGDYNAAAGVVFNYENSAANIQDDHQYSVMSYFDESSTTSSYDSYPDTLMLYDIYAVQQLYGANMSTRATDTVYGFHSNAGAVYDFASNTTPAFSIWDGGGSDTIDASGYAQAQTLDLHDGTFSSIGGLSGNVSIAFNATIENAIGGSGADTIIGNAVSNVLTGGAGADIFSFKDPLSAALNVDRITDFNVADDTIWLDSRVFAALAPGALSADAFHMGTAASDPSDRIMYDNSTGELAYDRDGAGGFAAVHFANIGGGLPLTSADFMVG
jgi:serralysin